MPLPAHVGILRAVPLSWNEILRLMTYRERIEPAVLAQGRAQVTVALERLSA